MRDVILAIRADEAHHRVVNHTLSSLPLCARTHSSPVKKSCERLRIVSEAVESTNVIKSNPEKMQNPAQNARGFCRSW